MRGIAMQQFIRWLLLCSTLLWLSPVQAADKVVLVPVQGAIGPVTQELIVRGIEQAEAESAALLILEMNTPGGLDSSMRAIIKRILASRVPVATYVAPSGSRAASAGTYILYASHIAAMAPATNLGSATPVEIGGLPELPSPPSTAPNMPQPAEQTSSASTMEKKIINDAAAYIRGLAALRGRNVAWAEQAVYEAVNLTASEAQQQQVIDVLAKDLDDLLRQLEGREITTALGKQVLSLQGAELERIAPDWRSDLLAIIANPNVAMILLMIGIYGLFIEFSNPGFILPGVVGSISLLLAAYALQMLPVNYVGMALVIIGIGFISSEFFVSSGGVLGIGGLLAFVLGALFLFDDRYLAVSLPLLGGIALVAGGLLLWIVRRFAQLRRRKVVSGQEYMVGRIATVSADFTQHGRVQIDGESWQAASAVPMRAGQQVRIQAVNNLVLEVQPQEQD